MTKRAVLYGRVSTVDQADKGYSLPSQFDAMRKYAAREGFEIVAEFQDDYSGATPIEHRPEGRKAYALLQSDGADAIVAYTIDRFVRPPEDGDEWEMPILIRGLAKLGKEIHTAKRGKLNTSFADLLIALLDARKAGEERRDIRERSMRGKRAKVKSGRVLGMRTPYGYRHVRDSHGKVITLEIDEITARVVRLIYRWYVIGDETGLPLSARAISKRLSEMKVSTPGERGQGYKRKHESGIWSMQTVLAIITNEVYAGRWRYGLRIPKRDDFREGVAVDVPAIIDRDLWDRAQARREYNQRMSMRNAKRNYLLRGLIRCGCNYSMCGDNNHHSRVYSCITRRDYIAGVEKNPCHARSVRADAIEADVWDEIHELFSDLDRLWDALRAAQQSEEDRLEPIRGKLEITDGEIKRTERDADNIARALRDAEQGGAVYRSLKRDEQETNAKLDSLLQQRERLLVEIETLNFNNDAAETIMQFARNIRLGIENADYSARRQMLESLDIHVTVKEGRYRIKCVLGETEGEISQMRRGGVRIVPNSS